MKVAFAGKGGVGKSTIASLFIKALERDGSKVLAVDCDPVANLGRFLGITDADEIVPIAQLKELINERTEATPDRAFYKLNPKVDDIPEKYSKRIGNARLIVMGCPRTGGTGCMCPESSFLKALLSRLLLQKDESVVMDMEAGVEHLGRATAGFVDHLFIVVEPSLSSIAAAKKIAGLAKDIMIKNCSVIINKVRSDKDAELAKKDLSPLTVSGCIPFDEKMISLGMQQGVALEKTDSYKFVEDIKNKILERGGHR